MNEKTEMPEEPEVPEVPEEKEHHPAKQSSGSSAAFLATAIALAAGGGTFYMWQQQQAMHKETQALELSIDRLLSVVEERHKTELQRIDALAQHHHPETEAQLGRVETLVHDLRGRLGQERREWAVAEVEYLLRVADHRLTLEHDKDTALAALRDARQRLALQEQDVYQPVIRQIDSDVDKLSAVSLPDRDRIAAELATLSAAVEQWPYAIRETALEEQPAAVAPEAAGGEEVAEKGWRKILAMIWSDIKSLVTIRHNGEVPRPLLEPEQHYFLQQNMQLKLQAARLALLGGNNRAYRDSLNEAAAWLQRYFDTSAPAVREAQATIEQLAEIDLEPALPALGNSIELLQQAAMQIPPSPAPAPVPAPAPPATPAEEKPEAKPAAPVAPPKESEAAPAAAEQAPAIKEPATAKPAAPAEEQKAEPSLPAEESATDVPALPQGNGL